MCRGSPVVGSIAAPSLRGRNAVTPFFGLRPPRTLVGRIVNRVARAMIMSSSHRGVETFNGYLAEEGLPPVTVENYFDCPQQPDVARRVFNTGLPELDYPDVYISPNTEWVGALLPRRAAATAPLDPRILERSGMWWSSRREPSTTTTPESSRSRRSKHSRVATGCWS